jgi:hypothetical protein
VASDETFDVPVSNVFSKLPAFGNPVLVQSRSVRSIGTILGAARSIHRWI